MIDFHSHILYGLDDGIQTLEESIEVIKEAKEAGFTKIICTTHNSNNYDSDERERNRIIAELKQLNLGVDLLLGNEIYATSDALAKVKNNEASTLNKTNFVLFEMPLHDDYPELKNFIIDFMTSGYRLVLAHPERYRMFRKDPKMMEEILDLGVYFQANYMSIEGLYGSEAKKMVELLFKHDMITFLGTDVHSPGRFYPYVGEASKKIIEITGEEKFEKMTNSNIEKVLLGGVIEREEYIPFKKTLFGNYK